MQLEKAREVETQVYSQAMVEMRTMIHKEVKEIRRLSGLPVDDDHSGTEPVKCDSQLDSRNVSNQSGDTDETIIQSKPIIEKVDEKDEDIIEVAFDQSNNSDEIELQIQELELELKHTESREEINMSQSECSEISTVPSDYKDVMTHSVPSDEEQVHGPVLDERKRWRCQQHVSLDDSDTAIDRIVSFLMEEQALSMSETDSMQQSMEEQALAMSDTDSMQQSMYDSIEVSVKPLSKTNILNNHQFVHLIYIAL